MTKSTQGEQSLLLRNTFVRCRGMLVAVMIFSFFINVLMFVGPLYMLQIYDRVLSSRSEVTLIMISVLAIGLLLAYGVLEGVRSRILVRAGVVMDAMMANKIFKVAFRGHVLRPGPSIPSHFVTLTLCANLSVAQELMLFVMHLGCPSLLEHAFCCTHGWA